MLIGLFPVQSLVVMMLICRVFENIVRKGENAVTSIFSFSHNVFYPIKEKLDHLSCTEIVFKCM